MNTTSDLLASGASITADIVDVGPAYEKRPVTVTQHGEARTDDYGWLRDGDSPAFGVMVGRELEYRQRILGGLDSEVQAIYSEIVSHVKETDVSAPDRAGAYEYLWYYTQGQQYPRMSRRIIGETSEEALLDIEKMSAGHEYYDLPVAETSPDQTRLYYIVDVTGGERYTAHVLDIASGEIVDTFDDVYYDIAWIDEFSFMYTRCDSAMRAYQVLRHRVGRDSGLDELVYQEDDEQYSVSIARARSGKMLVLASESSITSEVRLISIEDALWQKDQASLAQSAVLVSARDQGVMYDVNHWAPTKANGGIGGQTDPCLFIITNADRATNFKLCAVTLDENWRNPGALEREAWTTIIDESSDTRLEAAHAFESYVVVSQREGGDTQLRFLLSGGSEHIVDADSACGALGGAIGMGNNSDWDPENGVRIYASSLVVAPHDIDYDPLTGQRTVVKVEEVPGFNADNYISERVWSTSVDGTQVPITVARRKDVALDGSAPLLAYGYGAYEISIDATFDVEVLPLLDRGFVYSIIHVRGGGECGRRWYEDGKLGRKRNSFGDFITGMKHLCDAGYTAPGRIVSRGRSAGGLLMGVVANLAAPMLAGVVAGVPFVDAVNTMSDASLPLTAGEWDEWGNPITDERAYRHMSAYDPYGNVSEQAYPKMLITGGKTDPRVSFWEPLKWAAKLRAKTTGSNPIIVKFDEGSGHFGPSGRYDAWLEEAQISAFCVWAANSQ